MVPKRIDASCLALPPTGRSSSSSVVSLSESTTDQSSSSGRTRDGRVPVGVLVSSGATDLAFSCCVRRWKGLVDTSLGGEVTDVAADEGPAGVEDSLD